MSSEVLLSNIIPFAGSGLVGYAICFLAGMFFVGVQLLQKYGYVSAVACALQMKLKRTIDEHCIDRHVPYKCNLISTIISAARQRDLELSNLTS